MSTNQFADLMFTVIFMARHRFRQSAVIMIVNLETSDYYGYGYDWETYCLLPAKAYQFFDCSSTYLAYL